MHSYRIKIILLAIYTVEGCTIFAHASILTIAAHFPTHIVTYSMKWPLKLLNYSESEGILKPIAS